MSTVGKVLWSQKVPDTNPTQLCYSLVRATSACLLLLCSFFLNSACAYLAELDDIRQGYLLDAIGSQTQTIITSVDTLQFKESYLEKVDILKIKSGELLTN